jgi:endonuclease YncB( thermonuclease family)
VRAFVLIVVLALLGAPAAVAVADPAADVVIGEYKLDRVVDGDTVRVKGLDSSLRLLGIDSEETFKHDKERRAYAKGWDSYTKAARGSSPRPAKFATPLGDAAKTWAEQWFAGVDKVRLERDDPHEVEDRYRRYLAYVLAEKHGKWLNYNVEAVRAGMSPYFPKYGRSRRFDRDFIAAEAEAKAAKRGIWAPGAEAYPDYPEREAWWTARGDFVATFHREAAAARKHAPMIDLTHDDAPAQLEANVGHEVSVLATVGEIEIAGAPHRNRGRGRASKARGPDANAAIIDDKGDKAEKAEKADTDNKADEFADGWAGDPDGIEADGADDNRSSGTRWSGAANSENRLPETRPSGDTPSESRSIETQSSEVRPSETRPHGGPPTRVILDNHVPLVFFDPDVFAASGISAWKGEWIRVTGRPSLYHGKVEIVIDRTGQVDLSPVPGLTKPTRALPRNHEKSVPIHAP